MQNHNIRLFQQFLLGNLLHIVRCILLMTAALGQNPAAKGMEQFGATAADLAETDDTHSLALQLTAHQTILSLTGTAAALHSRNIPQNIQRHTQHQLCNRLIGIAGSIADSDALFFSGGQIHMIHTGEGHIDKL